MMTATIRILSLLFAITGISSSNIEENYLFAVPRTLPAGGTTKLCLTMLNADLSVVVGMTYETNYSKMGFHSDEKHPEDFFHNKEGKSTCYVPEIPKSWSGHQAQVELSLVFSRKEVYYSENRKTISVTYDQKLLRTIIETDRPLYRPGETVKFRILNIQKDLKPHFSTTAEIIIEDPNGEKEIQWINPVTVYGITSLQFHLESTAHLGNWSIQFKSQLFGNSETMFIVANEKHDAWIVPPKMIMSSDVSAEWTVCAYSKSDGKPFVGSLYMLFKLVPVANLDAKANEYASHYDKIQGCLTFRKYIPPNSGGFAIRAKAILHDDMTEITTVVTSSVIPSSKAILNFPPFYNSGIPLRGKLLDSNPNETVEICLKFKIRNSHDAKKLCRKFRTNESGATDLELPAPTDDISSINITASNLREEKNLLQHWFHANASELKIIETSLQCDGRIGLRVQYTDVSESHHFYCQVTSNGQILYSDSCNESNSSTVEVEILKNIVNEDLPRYSINGIANINISLSQRLPVHSYISIYYVDDQRRVISDSIHLDKPECLKSGIEINFKETLVLPGDTATLTIKTTPYSFCSITSVEEHLHSLRRNNGISFETVIQQLFANEMKDKVSPLIQDCRKIEKYTQDESFFKDETMEFMSSYSLTNRTCANAPFIIIKDDPHNSSKSAKEALLTNIFASEAWIWEVLDSGEKGIIEISQEVPNRQTKWVTDVFCVSSKHGLVFASPVTLEVVDPHFITILTPDIVKLGESFPVIVAVSAFTKECSAVEVQLTIEFSNFGSKSFNEIQCICGHDIKNFTFQIKAEVVGDVKIFSLANTVDNNDICQETTTLNVYNNQQKSRSKMLYVEFEGCRKELTNTRYLCCPSFGSDAFAETVTFPTTSEKIISESFQSEFLLTGDIVKTVLKDLKQFIHVPRGNGEENMVFFGTNLVVLSYLKRIDILDEERQIQLYNNLRIGFERQLNYLHDDKFFTLFGKQFDKGNIWLNAFILKCFSLARQFISLTSFDRNNVINWIKEKQLENGCFPSTEMTVNKELMGGLGNDSISITAYILVSLLESDVAVEAEVIVNALTCLKENEQPDFYAKVLTAYAASLAMSNNLTDELLDFLNIEEDLCKSNDQSCLATQMEIRSYITLALLSKNPEQKIDKITGIIQSFVKQLNDFGGFLSFQGTIVGLQALSTYIDFLKREEINLNFTITGEDYNIDYYFNRRNQFYSKEKAFSGKNERSLSIHGTGVGCVVIQRKTAYNTPDDVKSDLFDLEIKTKSEGTTSLPCEKVSTHICIRYKPYGKELNLAVIELQMISGFEPCELCLNKLLSTEKLQLNRCDRDKNRLILYFNKLTNKQKCFSFNLLQVYEITDRKPSVIKIYDYFAPKLFAAVNYGIPGNCIEEPLPEISPDFMFDLESMIIPGILDETCENCKSETDVIAIPETYPNVPVEEIIPDPVHIKPLGSSLKKNLPENFKSFHDTEWDLEVPDGLEGVQEVFIAPPNDLKISGNCPKCYNSIPENFEELYCKSEKVYSVFIEDIEEQRMKIVFDVSSDNPLFINKDIHYISDPTCDCPLSQEVYNNEYILMGSRGATDNKSPLKLNSLLIIVKLDKPLLPDVFKVNCNFV